LISKLSTLNCVSTTPIVLTLERNTSVVLGLYFSDVIRFIFSKKLKFKLIKEKIINYLRSFILMWRHTIRQSRWVRIQNLSRLPHELLYHSINFWGLSQHLAIMQRIPRNSF
jgi:hypothetical protein